MLEDQAKGSDGPYSKGSSCAEVSPKIHSKGFVDTVTQKMSFPFLLLLFPVLSMCKCECKYVFKVFCMSS